MRWKRAMKERERSLQNEIFARFGAERDLYLLRNTVGVSVWVNEDGKERKSTHGLGTGTPDLVGMLLCPRHPKLAVWVGFELKAEGKDAKPHQSKQHEIWRKRGALVYSPIDSIEAFALALEDARKRVA